LALMTELAALIDRHIPEAEIFDPCGLVTHFARTIRRELNFLREGRTIETFARLFHNDATLFVPRVYPELTTEAVLTMQFVDGCHILDREALAKIGIAPRELASNMARVFMKMAFDFGIFHGDPHPGNIRVMSDGSIALLDYGMIGMLEEDKRDQMIDVLQAVLRQDLETAADVVQELGHPFRPTDTPLLRADLRDFIENYYGLPLEKLNVGNLLTDFVSVISRHAIRCPADLMLLIRVFVTLEGTGRDIAPDFNLAGQLAPFVENIVRERYSPRRVARRMLSESRMLLSLAHDVPRHIGRTLEKLSRDDLTVQFEHRGIDHLITELDRSSNRLAIGMVISALVVATALIIRTGPDMLWFGLPAFVLSCLLGIWLIYGVFRSGRL
jgi:ubiquinone biosynthesis protein